MPAGRLEGVGCSLADEERTRTEGGLPASPASVCQQEWSRVRHAERQVPSCTSGFRRGRSIRGSDWIHRRSVSRKTVVTGSELYSMHV